MRNHAFTATLLLATLAAGSARAAAEEDPEIEGVPTIGGARPDRRAIVVRVRTDRLGLRADDFKLEIKRDAAPPLTLAARRVTGFRDTDADLSLVILVEGNQAFLGGAAPSSDAAAAPAGDYHEVARAIDVVAGARGKHTQVALLVYGDDVQLKAAFGPADQLTGEALGPLAAYAGKQGHAFHRGLVRARELLEPRSGRRAIFVIGDGADDDRAYSPRLDLEALAASDVEVYFLATSPTGLDARERARAARFGQLGEEMIALERPQLPQVAAILRAGFNDHYTLEFPLPAAGGAALFDGRSRDVSLWVGDDLTDPVAVVFPAPAPAAPATTGHASGPWLALTLAALAALGVLLALALRRRLRRRAAPTNAGADDDDDDRDPAAGAPAEESAPRKTMIFGAGSEPVDPSGGWIVPLNGPERQHGFRLHPGMNVIGRGQHCDIRVDDPLLGAHHAVIAVGVQGVVLADAGCGNGVIVGSRRTQRHELHHDDIFTCGQTQFRFRSVL